MKTCGDCGHWAKVDFYTWGKCRCPLPEWMAVNTNLDTPTIYPDDDWAVNCECYKEEKDGSRRTKSNGSVREGRGEQG
jgi:hypothetical protein